MKKNKKLLSLVMASTVALTTCFVNTSALTTKADTVTTDTPKTVPQTASTQYAAAMEPGWNLGNTYDALNTNPGEVSDETAWGNPIVTKALIDKIAAEGFKSIRMPFTAFTRIGAAPDYTIDPVFLARYAQTVQWAVDDGLYVMVNTHHDSWAWEWYYEADDDNGVTKAEYQAVWTQLANYFKNYDSKVCFESTNEIGFKNHSGDVSDAVKNKRMADLNKQFHDIVRQSGGNNTTRMLVLPMIGHDVSNKYSDATLQTIQELNVSDPNILTSFHYYGPWCLTNNLYGYSTINSDVVNDIKTTFDVGYNNFVKNGIGVLVGEYGLLDSAYDDVEYGEQLKFLDYVNYYAKVDGLTMMLWDRGTNYLDRNTLTWKDPKKIATIKAEWTGRASYAYSDRIFVKDQNKNSDFNIPLTLNGNTLSSIYNGTTQLVEGQDYTYADSTVTLKGSYVSNLMTAGYGTKANLTFKFSAGPDWDANLINYTTPVVGSTTGSTSNFVIPVQFNGSKLLSLEAVNVGQDASVLYTGVGETSWSSYKPYDAYKADYTANTVTMTKNFFSENYDKTLAQYVIKLHFQSGEEQDLTINQANGQLTYTAPVVVAAPTAKVAADNDNVIVERKQSASFTVSMNQLTNANAFDVTLKYDSSLYNVSNIDYLSGLTQISKSDNDGTLRLIFGKTDKTTITAADYTDLVKVTLVPKTVSISQDASVTLVNANTASINNNVAADAACTLGQATGKTTIKLASDINGIDGVTLADLSIALADYMDDSNSTDWKDSQKADVNGDGVVDIVDLQLIAGYIVSLQQ